MMEVADESDVAHFDLWTFGNLIDYFGIGQVAALEELTIGEPAALLEILLHDLLTALAIEIGIEWCTLPNASDVFQVFWLDVLIAQESDFLYHVGHFPDAEKDFGVVVSIRLEPRINVAELARLVQFAYVLIDDGGIVFVADFGAQAHFDLLGAHPLIAGDNHVANEDLPWRSGQLRQRVPAAEQQAEHHGSTADGG